MTGNARLSVRGVGEPEVDSGDYRLKHGDPDELYCAVFRLYLAHTAERLQKLSEAACKT